MVNIEHSPIITRARSARSRSEDRRTSGTSEFTTGEHRLRSPIRTIHEAEPTTSGLNSRTSALEQPSTASTLVNFSSNASILEEIVPLGNTTTQIATPISLNSIRRTQPCCFETTFPIQTTSETPMQILPTVLTTPIEITHSTYPIYLDNFGQDKEPY